MKSSIKRFGIIFTLFFSLLMSVGCSKSGDGVVAQPTEISPSEKSEPVTPNAPAVKPEITKEQQSREMPMPGQANDHSTLAPDASQKNHKP